MTNRKGYRRTYRRKFRQRDLPTGRESIQSHVDFIRLNWEAAAATAWRDYITEGRGAIILDVAGAEEGRPNAPLLGTTPGYYSTRNLRKLGKAFPRK